MTPAVFVRARRPEQKQQRKDAILAAARALAEQLGVQEVTLAQVASAVGLAKSNVVRYFGSREEIYLELAAAGFRDWAAAANARIEASGSLHGLVLALSETLAERSLFCDLLSHVATSLEDNVSVTAARRFKQTAVRAMAGVAMHVASVRPELADGEATELVTAAIVLASALYPIDNPSATLVELYDLDPKLAPARLPFLPTLTRTLTAIAVGLPAMRSASRNG